MHGIMQYFCSVMGFFHLALYLPGSSVLSHMAGCVRLSNIPLCIYTTCLSIYLFVDIEADLGSCK